MIILDGVIESEIYKTKKNEVFEQKLKINEELEQIKQNGSNWLEPFREWIGSAFTCAKIARAKNTSEELAFFGKTVGSNFFLTNRQLALTYKKGFAELWLNPPSQSHSRLNFADSLSVGVTRIELATSRTPCARSTDDLHPGIYLVFYHCCIYNSM